MVKNNQGVEKKYPEVKFDLSTIQDILKIDSFLQRGGKTRGGVNLTGILLNILPNLRKIMNLPEPERSIEISSYVSDYYRKNKSALEKSRACVQRAWNEYSPVYFKAIDKIFKGCVWPDGKYIGYLSISPPYPRYLDKKVFHVPHDNYEKGINVTAHEMMHFIFYEYVRKRYLSELSNTIEREINIKLEGKFTIPIWEMSEVFNIVVLADKQFGADSRKQLPSSYSDLVAYAPKFEEVWQKSGKDVDKLFDLMEKKDSV